MNLFRPFTRRLGALFRKGKLDRDTAEEMRFHLDERTAENIADGLTAQEARYAAQRKFGGIEQIKELARDQRAFSWDGLRVIRHGYTSVRRSPLLALTIIGTLGIALAACVLVFSFLNTFLLRPLPHGDADRMLVVYEHSLKGGPANSIALTYDNLVAIEEQAGMFSRLGILRIDTAALRDGEAAEVASLQRANADLFPLMGARAALGANPGDILRLVLGDSLRLTLVGLAAGAVLAFAASRSLTGLLYGVPSLDPLVYAGGALLMTAACSGAALLPARRAARVNPITALRTE